jgi:hypothetical protein
MVRPIAKRLGNVNGEPARHSGNTGRMQVRTSHIRQHFSDAFSIDKHLKRERFVCARGVECPATDDRIINRLKATAYR